MRLLVGKHGGFCFGVQRAVDMAEKEAKKGRVYTYGNIIHNEIVVEELKEKGIVPVQSLDDLKEGDTLIIRAHGVPPKVYKDCEEKKINVVDATCPFVRRIHKLVEKCVNDGGFVYIIGKPNHPEVVGICGFAKEQAIVLENIEEAQKAPVHKNACCVAQTTHPRSHYHEMTEILKKKMPDLVISDTICDTTVNRQTEAAMIAKQCNKVLVLGSSSSANTIRLGEICREHCNDVQNIEEISKFSLANLKESDIIGIVAGASTPDRIIREVIEEMSDKKKTTVETIEAETKAAVTKAKKAAENKAASVKKDAEKKVASAKKDAEKKVAAAKKTAEKKVASAKKDAEKKAASVKKDAEKKAASVKKDAEKKVASAKKTAEKKVAAAKKDVASAKKDAEKKVASAKKDAEKKAASVKKEVEEKVKEEKKKGFSFLFWKKK